MLSRPGLALAACGLLALAACDGCKRSPAASDAGAPPVVDAAWLEGRPAAGVAGTPTDGGTLVVRAMSEPSGLNFLDDAFRDAWTSRITRNLVFESLLEIDGATGELKPQLAEAWRDSDDHRTTTFTLRAGVTFSSGEPFTSGDVVAVFSAVMDTNRPTGGLRGDFTALASFRAVDARTVELRWSTPSPFALRQVAKLPMYSRRQLEGAWAALAQAPIGTGPYVVGAWARRDRLELTRRPGWWGGQPHLERIVFRFVKDHTVAAALFEQGTFDLMTNIQPSLWRALEAPTAANAWAQTGYRRLRSQDNSYSYIAWNQAVPALRDVQIRRALAHAYPHDVIARGVDLGLEVPTACPYYLEGGSCDPAVRPLPHAPEVARALLTDAGISRDAPLTLRFLMPAASVRLGKLVPLLQEQLAPLGVDLVAEKVDGSTLSARLAQRDFEAVSRVWTEFDTEQDLYPLFHSSQMDGGLNFVGYQSPQADALLAQIRSEWAPNQRRALEQALHRQLVDDQPYLFMTARQSLDAAKQRVHGLQPSVVWYDLRQVWVDL